MTTQPTLFGYPTTRSAQRGLYDDTPADVGLSCACGSPMVETASGYICCSKGCGKLLIAVEEETPEEPGLWSHDDAP